MKTKYLDTEIERLNLLERNNELTDWGKEMLSELKEIKQALLIPRVSQQRELLIAAFERLDRPLLTMIEIGDYEKAVDEILSY